MVYTQKHPALLIMGVILLALGASAATGMQSGLIDYLGTKKLVWEISTLGYTFGGIAVAVGLWHLVGRHVAGNLDYYLSAVGGVIFIFLIAMLVRWYLAPFVAVLSKMLGPVMADKYLHQVLGLNYVVLGIIAGIVVVNVFRVPRWAENGVRLSRLGLKTGVVLLGVLYSAAELRSLGGLSILMIGFFVLGSVGLVLWMGARRKVPNSMGGVLSAGMGVCGVSAAVAAAPVVQAKSVEIAYTIGTILLWGVGCMFLFPVVGHLLNMGHVQFGAWAGTGILNSAQVAGAALAFQPNGIETLKVAEIFNITRVLVLPIIVVWLSIWYVKREVSAPGVSVGRVVFEKFPLFVIGFLLMFALSSTGVFAPAQHYKGKYFDNNIKEEKLLDSGQVAILQAEVGKLQREDQKAAIGRLIDQRKVMSPDDDDVLRGVVNSGVLSKDASKVLKGAHKVVRHTAKKISAFRTWITLLFAFGLTGLGMQITLAAMKQAGGQPLVIGGVVGTLKAVLSLVVVLLLVRETI